MIEYEIPPPLPHLFFFLLLWCFYPCLLVQVSFTFKLSQIFNLNWEFIKVGKGLNPIPPLTHNQISRLTTQAECTVGNMSFENRMWMKLSLPLIFFTILLLIFLIFLVYMLFAKLFCSGRHVDPGSYILQMFRRSFNAYFTLLGISYLTLADTLVSFFECKVGLIYYILTLYNPYTRVKVK